MNSIALYIVSKLVHLLPDTSFWGIKRVLYRCCGVSVGKNVRICSSVHIVGNSTLTIGDNVWIGHDALIVCSAPIIINRFVNIAPRVYLGTGTHLINPYGPSVAGDGRSFPIVIKEGVWLCANSQILAGVTIGERSIVAMGGVVLKDVCPFRI